MMALPQCGFVWLSMPKCASTAVEQVLEPYARAVLRGPMKHLNYRSFQNRVVPVLAIGGWQREDYEVVCLFRDPVDWLESWWRYRSRPSLKDEDPDGRWTGAESFTAFADRYVARDPALRGLGRPANFGAYEGGALGIDRLLRYEATEVWQDWLSERVGRPLDFARRNVSTRRPADLDPAVRRRLVELFTPEYDICEHLRPTGTWQPRGYLPAGAG